jgi:hypothetical protein
MSDVSLGCIHEFKHGHVLGIPAVHGLKANLALGIATLLERQTSRRHLIFGPAIRTFEDHIISLWLTADDVERPARGSANLVWLLGKSIIEEAPEYV